MISLVGEESLIFAGFDDMGFIGMKVETRTRLTSSVYGGLYETIEPVLIFGDLRVHTGMDN